MKFNVFYILIIAVLTAFNVNSQLNCSKSVDKSKQVISVCLHENGLVSTREVWDSLARFGGISGFNSQGKQLFYFNLRKVGGNASVSITYFPNGQVNKVNFSDQPDGGIQYFESTTVFNEYGEQTSYVEYKNPDELITFAPPSTPKPKPKTKQEVAQCAAIIADVFEIQNLTHRTVKIAIFKSQPYSAKKESQFYKIRPHKNLIFDTIFSAQKSLDKCPFEIQIIDFKRKKQVEVQNTPKQSDNNQLFRWIWLIYKPNTESD